MCGQQKTVVRLLFVVFRSLLSTVFARVDVGIFKVRSAGMKDCCHRLMLVQLK